MRLLTTAIVLSILASAGAASAQTGPQRQDPRHGQGRDQGRPDQGGRDQGHSDNDYERHAAKRYAAGRYQPPRGYQARQWRRGDTLPASYRARSYVVDHRRYGLSAPPRGYQYVRVRDDVFLTAIATGVISSVTLQLFQ